ncbi:MAG: glycyl radical protein [Deltaproteobacteria bacterium]|jgi:formate C-acetyltransferase|nr:glycyl radical protein [Deltaproteobacteria bacterium]
MTTNLAYQLSPQEERIAAGAIDQHDRPRPFKILDSFQGQTPAIDIERALYFTRSMRQTEGQPLTLRWAKALKHIAENITVRITDDQLLAGRAGQPGRYGILYPEIDGDFYPIVLENLHQRQKNTFNISQADAGVIASEVASFWKGKTFHEHLNQALPDYLRGVTYTDSKGLSSKFVVSETSSYRSALQWVHDYEKVLKRGLLDIQNEMKEKLSLLDKNSVIDQVDKKPFYEAMVTVCDAVMIWAARHAKLASQQAAETSDETRRAELLKLAAICERVPAYPARTFHEALQSQWFIQLFSRIEQKASAVISNGRMDQYLYPYYLNDLKAGISNDNDIKELLECLWVEMAQFVDLYINPTGNEFNEAYAHWEAVTIGGQTKEGHDATNDLTYLFLESKREFPLNYPDLAARIHARSPQRYLMEVAKTIQDGSGFPKLINDEEIIPLYSAKGAPLPELLDYSVSGCTEVRMPNRDTYTSGCVYINFAAAIEFVLYNGRLKKYGPEIIGLQTGDPRDFQSWDRFYQAYQAQHLNLLNKALAQQYVVDTIRPEHFATPLASVLHDLCVKHAKDLQSPRIEEGFDISYFEFLGYGTVVDSLAAVKKLVFEDKKLTMTEVIEALEADFVGYEPVLALLKGAPKYGNNDPYADSIAREIDLISQRRAAVASAERGINVDLRYVPITSHVPFGRVISSTPNGRKAWTPLSDGSSASHGADRQGPTAVMLSNHYSKNYQLTNRASRLLNIKLSPSCVKGEDGAEKIVGLVRAWCDLKLWHMQFNIINKQTLLEAQKNPDAWCGLLVRIAGYSAYFCDLSSDLQSDIIERTEHAGF